MPVLFVLLAYYTGILGITVLWYRGDSPTPEGRRTFLALAAHVQLAAADLTLFFALCHSIKSNDGLARCAHDFVWFTVRALRDAGVSHLYRLYDTNRLAVSLSRYIREVAADNTQREKDLKSISEVNPSIKKLLRLRHEAISHTSEEVLDLGLDKYISSYPLSLDEMQDLLKQAQRLLECYSGEHTVLVTPALSDRAQLEVFALAAYLKDAIPTKYGIERIVLEQDGNARSKGTAV